MKRGEKVVPVFVMLEGQKVKVGKLDVSNKYKVPGGDGFILPYFEPLVEVTVGDYTYQVFMDRLENPEGRGWEAEYSAYREDTDKVRIWRFYECDYRFVNDPPEEVILKALL